MHMEEHDISKEDRILSQLIKEKLIQETSIQGKEGEKIKRLLQAIPSLNEKLQKMKHQPADPSKESEINLNDDERAILYILMLTTQQEQKNLKVAYGGQISLLSMILNIMKQLNWPMK